ncbi:aldo/keto reductase family protein [Xylanibacter oryzae]|uniref:aldo/keto reductase family protein n=1 Tax=Xylanibacter oryzae TaxID=185293 RepID=UPI0004BB6E8D|nr:aldo/keto reductase [Xylanibacter oryzae]
MDKLVKLSNGVEMPIVGFGTYSIFGESLRNSLLSALDNGCFLFDTAHCYSNEEDLGDNFNFIFNNTKYKRKDVFITTKIGDKLDNNGFPIGAYFYNSASCINRNHREVVFKQANESLKKLRTDYIDLLLMHWPYNDCLEEIWDSLECLLKSGKVRSIGLSNCKERHIKKILQVCNVKPMVNQIFVSPINIQRKTIEYCNSNKIKVESYSPLMCLRSDFNIVSSNIVSSICEKYGKTPAQVILRWNIQKGVIPIPRSMRPSRIESNYQIFDFELSLNEINSIDDFNVNYQYLPESLYCPGY